MLAHRQAPKHFAMLRHIADATRHSAMDRQARNIFAVHSNCTRVALSPADEQFEQSALTNPVAAYDRHGFARSDRQAEILDNQRRTPTTEQCADLKHGLVLDRTVRARLFRDR